MRFLPIFAAAIAAAFAAGLSVRARVPWLHTGYLMLQCIFFLACYWNLLRGDEVFESRGYVVFFSLLFAVSTAWSVIIGVFGWPLNFWVGAPLVLSLIVALWFAGIRLHSEYPLEVTQAGSLLFCGIMTLLALSETLSSEMRSVAIAFGVCWVAQGIFGWLHATCAHPVMKLLNLLVPPFAYAAAFAWLAYSLHGMQASLVKQEVHDVQVAELAVAGLEGE